MRLGLGPVSLKDATRSQLESLAAQAAASSFDAVWVAESRADGVGGGLAAAAMIAQAVPIRVGAVVDAGLYHPLHLAEDIAVADLASQGRIEVLLRLTSAASSRYETPPDREWMVEHLQALTVAMSGAHMQWNGDALRIPGRIEANQPAPQRLAVNPSPAQPVVPVWIEASEAWLDQAARELGYGVAEQWRRGEKVPAATGRWPSLLLCPRDVEANDLLATVGDRAGYFVVSAATPVEVASVGRRLAGPLRMPEFPEWINSRQ